MKALLIICLTFALDKEIYFYRELLQKSLNDAGAAQVFYDRLKDTKSQNPLVIAYKGMAFFMMSKHGANPITKLNYFKAGRANLEAAFKIDSNNIELIYLRYSVQINLPRFLCYHANQFNDRKKIIDYLKNRKPDDKDLRARIYNFMLQSKLLNKAEDNEIRNQ